MWENIPSAELIQPHCISCLKRGPENNVSAGRAIQTLPCLLLTFLPPCFTNNQGFALTSGRSQKKKLQHLLKETKDSKNLPKITTV